MVTASRGFDGACDVTGSESPAGDVPAPGVGGVKYVRCTLDVLSLSLPLTPVSEVPLRICPGNLTLTTLFKLDGAAAFYTISGCN